MEAEVEVGVAMEVAVEVGPRGRLQHLGALGRAPCHALGRAPCHAREAAIEDVESCARCVS